MPVVCQLILVAEDLLRSTDPFDQLLGAATSLQSGDPTVFDVLLAHLNTESDLVSRAALDTLISVNTPGAQHALAKIATVGPQWQEWIAAGLLAVPTGHEAAVRKLLEAAVTASGESGSALSLQQALFAYASREMPLDAVQLEGLMNLGLPVSYAATYVALRQGDRSNRYVQKIARADVASLPSDILQTIAVAARFLPDGPRVLGKLVTHEDVAVRTAATVSLAASGDTNAVELLVKNIRYGNAFESMLSAAGVRRLGATQARAVTSRILDNSRHVPPESLLRLIESWAWIDDAWIHQVIDFGLDTKDPDRIVQTLWLAGWKQSAASQGLLQEYLDHSSPAVRGMAAWALARSATPNNRPECERTT